MKKLTIYLMASLFLAMLFVSCETEDDFDSSFLIGKWKSGTLYDKYHINGTGSSWDESDDVREDEAQAFTWTLKQSVLTHIHILEIGGSGVPKIYTVTELTPSRLIYKDNFNKEFSFIKVND